MKNNSLHVHQITPFSIVFIFLSLYLSLIDFWVGSVLCFIWLILTHLFQQQKLSTLNAPSTCYSELQIHTADLCEAKLMGRAAAVDLRYGHATVTWRSSIVK